MSALERADAVHPFAGTTGLLARVGHTPLVRLGPAVAGEIPPNVEIFVKCEWFNPGGSVKDRAALAMVLDAERRGQLQPGATLLDASSGNTGIALAMVAAARGYKLVLCLPSNANRERKALLDAYGAQVVPTSPLEGSDGAIRHAQALALEHPDWVYLDQYSNPANWRAHYSTTGPELWSQTQGRLTHFVSCLGTSGTFVGVSRFFKQQPSEVVCVEVQPDSPFHGLEGLKHMETALTPAIYDPTLADLALEAPTEAAYGWVRRLARVEGMLVGPSGAAAVWAAVKIAQGLKRGLLVAVLPDSGARYASEPHLWSQP